jgi:hypothetical protein
MRALMLTMLFAACSGNSNNKNNPPPDMAMAMQPDLSPVENPDLEPACSQNPMTHLELINACTGADFVDKMPYYPTLAPNGQLPPLP